MRAPKYSLVQVEVTTRCNAACVYCGHVSDDVGTKDMSVERFQAVLRPFAPATAMVHLQGVGEPFLHDHLLDIVEWSKSLGLAVTTTTNLSILELDVIERLDCLYVSLDPVTDEGTDNRVGLSRLTVIDNLERVMLQDRRPDVYIAAVLDDASVAHLPELLYLARSISVVGVVLSPVFDPTTGTTRMSNESRQAAVQSVSRHGFPGVHSAALSPRPDSDCGWLEDKLYFDVNGSLRPCCIRTSVHDTAFDVTVGSNGGLCLSSRAEEFRRALSRGQPDDVCVRCLSNGTARLWETQ